MAEDVIENIHRAKGVVYKIYENTPIHTKKGGIMNKKTVVIETRSRKSGWDRTSFHALEVFGDQCDKYDYFKVGDDIVYEYRAESRCSSKNNNDRWFTSLYLINLSKKFMFDGPVKDNVDTNHINPIKSEDDVRFGAYNSTDPNLPF